jgi:hypothetical protein
VSDLRFWPAGSRTFGQAVASVLMICGTVDVVHTSGSGGKLGRTTPASAAATRL